MGDRGPLPKPEDERQGRNKPLAVAVRSKPPADTPPAPKGVKQVVKDLWVELWQSPVSRAWDPVMDGPLLERYARTLHRWINAEDELRHMQHVVTHGSQGQEVLHPMTKYVADLASDLMKMEDKLGLSPMARARLGLTIAEGEKTAAQLNQMVKNRRSEEV